MQLSYKQLKLACIIIQYYYVTRDLGHVFLYEIGSIEVF